MKQSGNVPVILIDSDMVYVTVGKKILFSCPVSNIMEATVGYLASFYLLDFDYPKMSEVGLNVLQHLIFQDKSVPKDIGVVFKCTLKAFHSFKAASV